MIPDNGVWVEIARFYGDGANYKSTWSHFSKVNKNAKLLAQAVEAGLDPLSVELIDAPAKVQGSKGETRIISCHLHTAPFQVQFCRFSKNRFFFIDFDDIY